MELNKKHVVLINHACEVNFIHGYVPIPKIKTKLYTGATLGFKNDRFADRKRL